MFTLCFNTINFDTFKGNRYQKHLLTFKFKYNFRFKKTRKLQKANNIISIIIIRIDY